MQNVGFARATAVHRASVMAVLVANRKDLHRFSVLSDCHLQIHAIALGELGVRIATEQKLRFSGFRGARTA